jgi:hypothetical protein
MLLYFPVMRISASALPIVRTIHATIVVKSWEKNNSCSIGYRICIDSVVKRLKEDGKNKRERQMKLVEGCWVVT